jgi:hypothetical protein
MMFVATIIALRLITSVSAAGNGLCYISTVVCKNHNEWSGYHDDSPFAVPKLLMRIPNIFFNLEFVAVRTFERRPVICSLLASSTGILGMVREQRTRSRFRHVLTDRRGLLIPSRR